MVKVSGSSIAVDIKSDIKRVEKKLKKMKEIKFLDPSIERKRKLRIKIFN